MPISKASSNAVAPAAKGDLVVGTTTNDSGILAVGSANQVLTVDSSTATGLKWAAASSPTAVGCLVYAGSNFDVANSTDTIINYDTEAFDTDGFHSTTTNTSRITIPSGKSGKYYVFWTLGMANGSTTGARRARIKLNGNTYQDWIIEPYPGTWFAATGATMINCSVNDYLQIEYQQTSGATRTYYGDSSLPKSNQFGAFLIGA